MRWRWLVVDAAVAAAAFAIGLVALVNNESVDADAREPDALAYALLALCSLCVVVRRRVPVVAAAVGLGGALVFAGLDYPEALLPVVLLPIYSAATVLDERASRLFLAVVIVVSAITATLGPGPTNLGIPALAVSAWLLGHYVRTRRIFAEEHARRAVVEERLRIARELHDVVAHTMSVVAMHAGTGRMVALDDPAAAQRALETIEVSSRTALREMRRLLGLLRGADDDESTAGLEPAPGLADLDALVARVRQSGLAVSVHVTGDRPDVPPGVDLSGYRIVQEALTNVIKHAGAVRATVSIRYSPRDVVIEVVDDGSVAVAATRAGSGHGLIGMQERVDAHGGSLTAGPRAEGGFGVLARLPLGGP